MISYFKKLTKIKCLKKTSKKGWACFLRSINFSGKYLQKIWPENMIQKYQKGESIEYLRNCQKKRENMLS